MQVQVQLYEAIVVDPAPDPTLPGHIKVKIPELFGDEEVPLPIAPLFPGGISGWGGIPPSEAADAAFNVEGFTDVKVVVVRTARETYRWMGTSQVWRWLSDNAGKGCGSRSPDGRHTVKLHNDDGASVDAGGAAADVAGFNATPTEQANVYGTSVRVGTSRDGSTAIEPFVLGTTFLTDFPAALTEIIAVLTMFGLPSVNTTLLMNNIIASLGAGAPYLSTVVKGE